MGAIYSTSSTQQNHDSHRESGEGGWHKAFITTSQNGKQFNTDAMFVFEVPHLVTENTGNKTVDNGEIVFIFFKKRALST